MALLYAGLFTEGSTDIRFLHSIVKKTLEQTAYECSGQIDIELLPIKKENTGLSFVEQVVEASRKGTTEYGIHLICIHSDADDENADHVYKNKINPAIIELEQHHSDDYCKILVAIIPIQETEAWMLADKELLKREIGTQLSDNELGINRAPETIAQPKEIIENAIRIAHAGLPKRRRKDLSIADLYLPIGQSLDLDKLKTLDSYIDFRNNIREAFKQLNLLHD